MTHFKKLFYAFWLFSAISCPANAQQSPQFALPVACTPGDDCWVLNYADMGAPGDGAATDPFCLARTYEAHKGTDFAIPDEAAMQKGVAVLAARDGTVMRVRDGEPDRWPTAKELEETKAAKRECGNAVLIDHGNGWQTMNCHMKKGSIAVKPGQKIKRGEKIGDVGMSGMTEFPHLHFGLIHKNEVIDPFTGANIEEPCDNNNKDALWQADTKLSYEPLAFFAQGFDDAIPSLKKYERALPRKKEFSSDDQNLLAYAILLGSRKGDEIDLKIIGPDGNIFAQTKKTQDRNRARQLYYAGRRNNDGTLSTGTYKASLVIKRSAESGEKKVFEKTYTAEVR